MSFVESIESYFVESIESYFLCFQSDSGLHLVWVLSPLTFYAMIGMVGFMSAILLFIIKLHAATSKNSLDSHFLYLKVNFSTQCFSVCFQSLSTSRALNG